MIFLYKENFDDETLTYHCPICEKVLKKNFGTMTVINYDDIQLYVTHCIECHTEIAVQPIQPRIFLISTKNEMFANLVKDTKQLVSVCSPDMNEDEITEKTFDTLSHKYEHNILKANEVEIKQIIQYQLCQKIKPNAKSFVYADIKDKCKNENVICF